MNQTKAIDAWRRAATDLGFAFSSPYEIVSDGKVTRFDGYLPEFGGPNGMVFFLTSDFVSPRVKEKELASSKGLYLSILNETVYRDYVRSVFVEALKDWGWFPNGASSPINFRSTRSAERKAAQPGAADNPDDAQRLREDH